MQILDAFHFAFDEESAERLLKRYDQNGFGNLNFSQFVQLFIQLQTLKINYRVQDQLHLGMITISYTQFLKMAMNVSIW